MQPFASLSRRPPLHVASTGCAHCLNVCNCTACLLGSWAIVNYMHRGAVTAPDAGSPALRPDQAAGVQNALQLACSSTKPCQPLASTLSKLGALCGRDFGTTYDLELPSIAFTLHGATTAHFWMLSRRNPGAQRSAAAWSASQRRSAGTISTEELARGIGWISSTELVTALVGGDFRLWLQQVPSATAKLLIWGRCGGEMSWRTDAAWCVPRLHIVNARRWCMVVLTVL